jgi:hypothetical protein
MSSTGTLTGSSFPPVTLACVNLMRCCSVVDLAEETSVASAHDFHKLRHAIRRLQHVSEAMDKEKVHAEKHFLKALRRLERNQQRSSRARWVKRMLGGEGCQRHAGGRVARVLAWYDSLFDAVANAEAGIMQEKPDKRMKEFIKAAMRVRKVNQQLMAFERGVRASVRALD